MRIKIEKMDHLANAKEFAVWGLVVGSICVIKNKKDGDSFEIK